MRTLEIYFPPDLVKLGRNGLEWLRTPTWEEWQTLTEAVMQCRLSSLRWLAACLRAGRRHFGDETVAAFTAQLEFKFPDMRAAEALMQMEMWPEDVPDPVLVTIAKKVSDPKLQLQWAELAAKEGLTPREVQSSIAATPEGAEPKVVRESAPSRKAGILTIEAIVNDFETWQRQVAEAMDEWDAATWAQLAERLRPFHRLYLEAVARAREEG